MDVVNEINAKAAAEVVTDVKPYNQTPGSHYVLKDVYSFFGNKIMNSVAVYIGCLNWKLDLQLLESYAVPTVVCDPFGDDPAWSAAVLEKRVKLMDWMKYLKESDCGTHFVNPKWIQPVAEYPGNFDGTMNLSADTSVPVTNWDTLVKKAASLRNKPSTEEPHFALCRIELHNEEINILSSLLASKYRPSILYVRWSESPDENQLTSEAAGHLQSCGYRLVTVNMNGFFMYHYTGQDIYSCCSWTNVGMAHPFLDLMKEQVEDFVSSLRNSSAKLEVVKDESAVSEGASNS